MSTIVPMQQFSDVLSRPLLNLPEPPKNLPTEDGINLESDWHRLALTLLIELVVLHRQGREDYFVGGNMFIYFNAEQFRNQDFRGPDFFFVAGVPLNPPRPYWAIWDEGGKYPNTIIELSSPSTKDVDLGIKKTTYEQIFRTPEYFVYDPDGRKLQGWRLNGDFKYQALQPNEKGWLWSEELQLWLGKWQGKYLGKEGVYLRFFDKDGSLVPSSEERTEKERRRAEEEKCRAEEEKRRAEEEKRRAEEEKRRAEEEKRRAVEQEHRAEKEKKRADEAEAELARFKPKSKKKRKQ